MHTSVLINRARRFLQSQGIVVGDALALEWFSIPGAPKLIEWLGPGVTPCYWVVGFCAIPMGSRRHPKMVHCQVEYDLSVETSDDNMFPLRVSFYPGMLDLPTGRLAILDCIEACRQEASYRGLDLGELLRYELVDETWTLMFGEPGFSEDRMRVPEPVLFLKVDDRTGQAKVVPFFSF